MGLTGKIKYVEYSDETEPFHERIRGGDKWKDQSGQEDLSKVGVG